MTESFLFVKIFTVVSYETLILSVFLMAEKYFLFVRRAEVYFTDSAGLFYKNNFCISIYEA